MISQQAMMNDALNGARCSNELLEHLEHLRETNDLFGNVAKSQGQCPGILNGDAVRPTPYRLKPVPGYPLLSVTVLPPSCHIEQLTCLWQVEGEMTRQRWP
jgi:hypothetical protein